ncbi:Uncharacterised protein [Aeromonas hydrophila]|nr:Uncharacterised protein [Aeromonas hydrophila]
MYSASAISMTEAPVSWLPCLMAVSIRESGMP